MSVNNVTVSGNLTRDAELRETKSGSPVLRCGLAVNSRRKNKETGEWEDKAEFIEFVMFGERARSLLPYLAKGTKVCFNGSLHTDSWVDKATKENRSKIEVWVGDSFEFLSPRAEKNNSSEKALEPNLSEPAPAEQDFAFLEQKWWPPEEQVQPADN